MKQSLQLKMGQHLTMTPQLQQAIRLLQLSTLDLQTEIQEALESNPMLEMADDPSITDEQTKNSQDNTSTSNKEETVSAATLNESEVSDNDRDNDHSNDSAYEKDSHNNESIQEGDWNDKIPNELAVDTSWDDVYQSSAPSGSGLAKPDSEDGDFDDRRTTSESLQDHLSWQLNLTPMSNLDRHIAETIIDAVGPTGMLNQLIDEIYEGLQPNFPELEFDEVFAVLHRLQQFDPPGVCSRDAKDCLLIQLNQLPRPQPHVDKAKELVSHHLALLGNRDFKTLMRKLKIKEPELRAAIDLIHTLNPHPGDQIGTETAEYVIPDVFVRKINNRWSVQLNPEIAPKLRINSGYASMVKRADSSADNTFLRDNLQEARWFLKSLQSRNETLLKVSTCIVEKQQGFLDFGPEAMKPMVLHDVAEIVEMHESTISRVTTQKFMHTPQGIFELKYFFSSHVATESGGECSSTAIRAIIKKLISAENSRKPLSDAKITALLEEQGIKVARRTIAKYRESLSIPPSNERKRLV